MANSAMSVVNQAQYSNFGSTFLGPVLSFFSEKLLLNQPQDTPIYFLAREGYWLQRAYNHYLHGAGKQRNSYYLLASRAFLFKLLLSDERSYMFSLKGDFCGSFYSLMRTRFLLSDAEITTLFTEQVFNSQIDLSKDKNKVVAMLSASRDKIDLLLAPIKCAYLAYLESIEVTSQSTLHLVDLGYSGTIQSLLGILLNKNTHGHYLISSNPGSHKIAGTSAFMQGYLKEEVKIGDGYLPLDRSMFLESRKVASQRYFYLLEQVMAGALSLCGHNAQYAISFTPNELEALLESYLAKPNMIPHAVRHIFDIDDDVTGNGTVNALQFFGLA